MKMYKTQEVADILNCSIETVRNLIKRGDLKVFKVGKNFRIKEDVLMAYIDKED